MPCLLLEPKDGQFLIRDANESYSMITEKKAKELTGKIIPDVFPENPEQLGNNWKQIHESLNKALITGKPDRIDTFRYDFLIPGLNEFEERYWEVENIPILDEISGHISYILCISLDKTSEVLQKRKSLDFQEELS